MIASCIHCGLCLPSCPTYALTGLEKSSPRGRIRLIKSVAEGTLDISDGFVDEMYFCLDCQACETVCPAGVQYGSLVEAARAQIAHSGREPRKLKLLRSFFLRGLLSSSSRIRWLAAFGRVQQKLGFLKAISQLRIFPGSVREFARMAPPIPERTFGETVGEVVRPKGNSRYRVGFLSGCVMNVLYPEIHHDSVQVLLHNDCEVFIPKSQVCCGSLLAHHGDFHSARKLARKNIKAFADSEIDALVVNAAGCSAFMKEYGHLLQDDSAFAQRGKELASRTKDILEFLVEIDFKKPTGRVAKRVTYHEACHLVHSQRISHQPREILRSIPGLEYVELDEASWCCGSAGIYNVVRYEDSVKLLERKMRHIQNTGADVVSTANPGCLLQLQYGSLRFGIPIVSTHVISLLRRGYEKNP
ncbi:MAG: (Fe-S)-binding protein [Bacteroidota bacterium]